MSNETRDYLAWAAAHPTLRIVTVAKVLGGEWFDRMAVGIRELAGETGIDATLTGADDLNAEKQVELVEALILQRPDAITVVPNAPDTLEATLGRAREAGIVVVTHEASSQTNTDVDIEAFDNAAYGAGMLASLASCLGETGVYAAFIGHAKAQSHIEWVVGASDRASSDFPRLERFGDPIETFEDPNIAYAKTKDLLHMHPEVTGFLGTGSTDVVGIGRAVREAGLQDRTCVVGTSIPSMAGDYLADGSIDRIFFWDPGLAGRAQVLLAIALLSGDKLMRGMSLGLPGYENLEPIPGHPHAYHGASWIEVDKRNAGDYPF